MASFHDRNLMLFELMYLESRYSCSCNREYNTGWREC